MTNLSFNFKDTIATAGLGLGGTIPADAGLGLDWKVPLSLVSCRGFLFFLNGIDPNQKMVDMSQVSNTWPLVSIAPYGYLTPMVSWLGSGRIFGVGYRWRYRYKSSLTGEVTGLSTPATEGLNLGAETTPGAATFLGQSASFYLPGRSGDDGTLMDRIQLFRNTSGQSDIWFLVTEAANPGSPSSYVLIQDDYPDDEIFTHETAGLQVNPSHQEGIPFPCAKAYIHPTGRLMLYGVVPMGTFRSGTASVTNGNEYATISGDVQGVTRNRIGQRFIPLATSGGTTITPTQGYRITAVGTGSEGNVDFYPAWAEGTLSGFHYEIDDDRDPRTIFTSEPNQPTNFDFLKTMYVGKDRSDGLKHLCGFNGVRYALTRRRIYAFENDNTLDPSVSIQFSVIAEEGACGLWAVTETPFGIVYYEESRGVRVFDGQSLPYPLGGEPGGSFLPSTQIANIDPDYLDQVKVMYDPVKNRVYVSYCPLGGGGYEECLVYDVHVRTWRGPWRMHLTSCFTLVNDGGAPVTVFGDEAGNLLVDDAATTDILSPDSGQSVAGTITNVDNAFTFRDTGGTWDPSTDRRIVGSPVIFTATDGTRYVNQIAGWDGTKFTLLFMPPVALTVGWTFNVAAIDWQIKTASLDAGEPLQPKTLDRFRMRLVRGTTGASEGALSAAVNGGTTWGAEGVDNAESAIVSVDSDHDNGCISMGGQSFQLRLRGLSDDGFPQITAAVADIKVGGGAARAP